MNTSKHERDKNTSQRRTGLFLAFMSGFTTSLSSLITKLATDSTFLQISFMRTLVIGCSTFAWLILNDDWSKTRDSFLKLPIKSAGWLIVRTASFFFTVTAALAVYQHLPMGDAASIFAAKSAFTGLMGVALLGEAWQLRHIYLTMLTWTGIALIYQPPFLFRLIASPDSQDPKTDDQSDVQFYMGIALLVPILSALSVVISRKLSSSVSPMLINSFTSFGVALYCFITLTVLGSEKLPPLNEWKYLIPEAYIGMATQTLMGKALQLEKAAPVTLMSNSTIVFSFIFQFVLFGTVPTLASLAGAGLIVLSTALLSS